MLPFIPGKNWANNGLVDLPTVFKVSRKYKSNDIIGVQWSYDYTP